jgi:hypothetical protein
MPRATLATGRSARGSERESDSATLAAALDGLRELARQERAQVG